MAPHGLHKIANLKQTHVPQSKFSYIICICADTNIHMIGIYVKIILE